MEAALGVDMTRDAVTCPVPFGGVLLLNNLLPHRSLPNYSDGIRWSLDLRWQRLDRPNGFGSIKPSVLMKSAGQAYNGSVQWGEWAVQDRATITAAAHAKQDPAKDKAHQVSGEGVYDHDGATRAEEQASSFDTTIAGPWMRAWPLVHKNRHTDTLR